MALQMDRIPATRRISDVFVQSSDEEASFSDMLFGFLEEGHNLSGNSSNSDNNDEEDDESLYNVEESKAFWKEQDQNLQVNFIYTLLYIYIFFFFKLWNYKIWICDV